MRLHSPPLTELHALAAVARLGSLTLAANELSVTQGAISRALIRLEEHFGSPLLVRGNRRTELTEAGRSLLEQIGPAIEVIERASSQLRMAARARELTLSVAPSFFSNWLVPRLHRFESRHPNFPLRFVHFRYDGEDFSGLTPDASIAIDPPRTSAIAGEYVIGRRIVPICPPSFIAEGKIKTPADLLNHSLLYHQSAPNNWSIWFKGVGMEDASPRPTRQFDYVTILIEAVIAGIGIAIVQRCLVEQALELGLVTIPFEQPVENDRGYYFCYPKVKADMPGLVAFKSWLLEEARACGL